VKGKVKQESVADFKQRIAIIMRKRNGYGDYSIVGAAKSDPCVVRKPTDKGYYGNSEAV
jgi:hypothetical protein